MSERLPSTTLAQPARGLPVLGWLARMMRIYAGFAGIVPKLFLAYSIWVWVEMIVQIIAISISAFFWRAIYAQTELIAGLTLQQTLNYILIAALVSSSIGYGVIFQFGQMLANGSLAIELLRPIDFQLRFYVEAVAGMLVDLFTKLPLGLVVVLVFGLQLPGDPLVWFYFVLALLLGQSVMFFFEWLLGCLAFYTTETWGLSVVRFSISLFFSGSLVPLVMMPEWLQTLTLALPFAQGLYVPVSLLSGIATPAEAPLLLLNQLLWIGGLFVVSRLVFRIAVRKVTVQGG